MKQSAPPRLAPYQFDPLLTDFKNVVEQGNLDHLQLTEQASMGHLLLALALEECRERINFSDLLCCPLGKIHNANFKFICGLSQQLPLVPQMLGSSQDAMLPACIISHANLSTCWRTRGITRREYVRWVWS